MTINAGLKSKEKQYRLDNPTVEKEGFIILTHLFHFNFFKYTGAILVAMLIWGQVFGGSLEHGIKTFTYKKVGDLEIKADVFGISGDALRPVVVWIHGGALIMGHREWIDNKMKTMLVDEGYLVVSIDYRLAPETKLTLIIEDIEDAFTWIYKDGEQLFGADTSRIAVMGSSAGGYLTLTSGFRAAHRPEVLVSFYGYGDLIGDWYSTPSKHQRHQEPRMTSEEAWKQVSGLPISDSRNRDGDGSAFYKHCRQNGSWPKAISEWDPHTESQKFYPYMPLKNVLNDYPPTMLIHGTDDTDVPYEQSVMMAEKLEEMGIINELVTVPGAEHGLRGGDPKIIENAYQSALMFLNKFMKD